MQIYAPLRRCSLLNEILGMKLPDSTDLLDHSLNRYGSNESILIFWKEMSQTNINDCLSNTEKSTALNTMIVLLAVTRYQNMLAVPIQILFRSQLECKHSVYFCLCRRNSCAANWKGLYSLSGRAHWSVNMQSHKQKKNPLPKWVVM